MSHPDTSSDRVVVSPPHEPTRAPKFRPWAVTVMLDGVVHVVRFRRRDEAVAFREQPVDRIAEQAERATADERETPIINPGARAGRTGHRLKVKDAKGQAQNARHHLGTSRSDTPTVVDLLRAATALSILLDDATEGEARLTVDLTTGGTIQPGHLLGTL